MKKFQTNGNKSKRIMAYILGAMLALVSCAAFAIFLETPHAMAATNETSSQEEGKFDHSHKAWTSLVKKHLTGEKVDYAGLHKNGRSALNEYLQTLESVGNAQYRGFTKNQKMSFGINAYNAYTIKLVLDNYPIRSLRKFGLLPGAAWREKFIPLSKIWGKNISLGELENDILRKNFKEPRLHFALVCASKSCPALRAEAYRAASLDTQLDEQVRRFLNNKAKNRFDPAKGKLYLSKIFDWYEDDFLSSAPSIAAYAATFMPKEVGQALATGNVKVEYLSYNWSLNGN
jgi:uncharacterized protein DUF547